MPAAKAACWRMLTIRQDARRGHPQSQRLPGESAGNLLKAPNGQLVLRTDFSVGQPVETGRGISMDVPSSVVGGDPKHLVFRLILWDAAQAQALWRGAEWLKVQPAAEAETPTPVSPTATRVPPIATPVPPTMTPIPTMAPRLPLMLGSATKTASPAPAVPGPTERQRRVHLECLPGGQRRCPTWPRCDH